MTVTNKPKTNITPQLKPKGLGSTWGDLFASWGDAIAEWGQTEIFTNKTKSNITPTNKTKVNATS